MEEKVKKYFMFILCLISVFAYAQFQYEFVTLAYIDEDGGTKNSAIGLDGTIFVANGFLRKFLI